jgi:hypothetical protein
VTDDQKISHSTLEVFQRLPQFDVALGLEDQLATGTLSDQPLTLPSKRDRHFTSTLMLWQKIMSEGIRASRTVVLHDVLLSEWFPRSPGRYHTMQAAAARQRAQRLRMGPPEEGRTVLVDGKPYVPVIYNLRGKSEMLAGGIGCIRLNRRQTLDGALWFMSVSSSPYVEQGVPIALTDDDYGRYIDGVTEDGAMHCTLTGKLMLLPDSLLSLYRDYSSVPRLYILVEKLTLARRGGELLDARLQASAAVMFTSDRREGVSAAYVSFTPGRNGNLGEALLWLEHYVQELHDGTVITDFDEQMTRFPYAAFSLHKIATGTLNVTEIDRLARTLRLERDWDTSGLMLQQNRIAITLNQLQIKEFNVNGDTFSNIGAGAVIVNRSTLTNALNITKTQHGVEAEHALQALAAAVETASSPEAAESLNELTEELAKPEPSSHRVRTWLNAITSALPNVAQVATATATLAQLVL